MRLQLLELRLRYSEATISLFTKKLNKIRVFHLFHHGCLFQEVLQIHRILLNQSQLIQSKFNKIR